VDVATLQIIQASDNCGEILGIETSALLGGPLRLAVSPESLPDVEAIIATPGGVAAVSDPRGSDIIVHHVGEVALVEFEPHPGPGSITAEYLATSALRRLSGIRSIEALWAETAREVRAITGFDHVMVYRFHPDEHGEVVAEDKVPEMESYLGLHYPASDIPAQARELYLTKLSRAIVSSQGETSRLLGVTPGPPLDLSFAELRSVSPHHLEFMRNMGQATSMSFSLIYEEHLIGMITCANRTPLRVRYSLRNALEVLATQVGVQIGTSLEIMRWQRSSERRDIRARIVVQMAEQDDVVAALLHGGQTVLDLVPAQGATLCLAGRLDSVGSTPVHEHIASFVARVGSQSFVTDSLPTEHPELAALLPGVAGVLMVPIGDDGDYLIWFRQEVISTVNWLGDQSLANRETPLSPRSSFSSWSESVTGTALPWRELSDEAAALCTEIAQATHRRTESALARLALHDPLTGLANRRLIMDRLEHALAGGLELAVLFVDLDAFKSVNDTFGHDAGDAVLGAVARVIEASTRPHDSVARIGGDEFIVLCEATTTDAAAAIASRIVEALRAPLDIGGRSVTVTASVGVASAPAGASAVAVLQLADAAMYRAKGEGRDQVSR
jgi:chemotaxis family two-component system sensor kinase Cph1